jgi:4'-phosphopantetheinyl transferase
MDQNEPTIITLWDWLTEDERQRAKKYRFDKDRHQFIVARGVLRQILSSYTKHSPRILRLTTNRYGRPSLSKDQNPLSLDFNLSHSGDFVLYAFSCCRRVGVDIEAIREDFATNEIAERFFSQPEVKTLKSLPKDSRAIGFFNCWTRKEAYIKALGEGLSHPLDDFSVSLIPGNKAVLLDVFNDEHERSCWQMKELHINANYAAAVIADKPPFILKEWEWLATECWPEKC